jgi:hypothetical protein
MKPAFCRVEYLAPGGWRVGHSGINLMDPEAYAKKLARPGRVIVVDTGQVFATPCTHCGADHVDGMCLV